MGDSLLTEDFVRLSRFAGSRWDLVQASGGNSSVKLDGQRMLVKASGFQLSEVEVDKGYGIVNYSEILTILQNPSRWADDDKYRRDEKVNHLVTMSNQRPDVRVSIEVFLHAVLGRFVLHTHPIAVNIIGAQEGWRNDFLMLFPHALCVPYKTPGIELGVDLFTLIEKHLGGGGHIPAITFLQNHGLIVSGDTAEEVQDMTEKVVRKCGEWCKVDFGRYQSVSAIEKYLGNEDIAYLCEDRVLTDLLETQPTIFSLPPFCPDSFVFCGVVPLFLENVSDASPLKEYNLAYQCTPKVVIYNHLIYFLGKNIKKAKEVEEVFKAHILTLSSVGGQVNYLGQNELAYLGNWEAEDYRRNK